MRCDKRMYRDEPRIKEVSMTNLKRHFIAGTLVMATLLVFSNSNCFAQAGQLRGEIPFDFYVGARLMPAGSYIVKSIGEGNAIQVSDGKKMAALSLTHSATNRDLNQTRMVFHRY